MRRRSQGMTLLSTGSGQAGSDGFVRHKELGIGWHSAQRGVVSFFDSPATAEVEMPYAELDFRPCRLDRERRVWLHDGIRWIVGRIYGPCDDTAVDYFVEFPNGVTERCAARELKVRWRRPLTDPVAMLKVRAVETRFFHDRRINFLDSFTEQRAACQGLGGVLSAGVEMHLHQVGAARRVLQDPIRRYLLADEVGLGKTIEAGMILRQLMIDHSGPVLVVVPATLKAQWSSELQTKFRLGQFGDRAMLATHDQVERIGVEPRLAVVVDEVADLDGRSARVADKTKRAGADAKTIAGPNTCDLVLAGLGDFETFVDEGITVVVETIAALVLGGACVAADPTDFGIATFDARAGAGLVGDEAGALHPGGIGRAIAGA